MTARLVSTPKDRVGVRLADSGRSTDAPSASTMRRSRGDHPFRRV